MYICAYTYLSNSYPMRSVPKCVIRSIEELSTFPSPPHDIVISCFITPKTFEEKNISNCAPWLSSLYRRANAVLQEDQQAKKDITFIPSSLVSNTEKGSTANPKLILSPISSLSRDVDDIRRITEAVRVAFRRAQQTGKCNHPLFIFPDLHLIFNSSPIWKEFDMAVPAACLAAYTETYQPPEAFLLSSSTFTSIDSITFAFPHTCILNTSISSDNIHKDWNTIIPIIESGRQLARDIGGGDPERMAPKECARTIQDFFSKHVSNVSVRVIDQLDVLSKEYPLLYAVSRASLHVPRHHPCVVQLEYKPSSPKECLYLVGKGICYDTGGADLKVGGAMIGMSRDKCGAANVAGFMAIVGQLSPSNIQISASLAFVRNSIGSDSYVSDEIIISRAGLRVRVGNTDAEGRMVMTDLLAEMKERALQHRCNSIIMTCATLTGHAGRAMGPYPICIDNWPAKQLGISKRLIHWGTKYGEPWESSNLRREDYNMNIPTNGTGREDLIQCNSQPSTMTARGHQFPMAFMLVASGLDKHSMRISSIDEGGDSISGLSYTHLDVAAATEESLPCGKLTGTPILTLTAAFVLHN